ncbi:Isopentenyl-diphosphate Delta-isomerase [Rhodotorula toruloides]|nr:Isopentenyl-diphosphate Delta-isomerase [Rhodotorula toruloides]
MSSTTHTITLDPSKYDQQQFNLMEERLILLDDDDRAIGEGSKKDCHLILPAGSAETSSPLHRAFSVFLFHPQTAAPATLRQNGQKRSDWCSVRQAAARELTHELGIPHTYPLDDFAYLTRIHYYAPSDKIWAEHEIDYIFFLTLDPKTNINPNEVSDVKWVSKADLEKFFKDPSSTFTPWFRLIAESFLYKWWDALLALRKDQSQPLDAKALIAEVEKEKATMGSIIRM